jgi:hypothetical protein
MNNGFQWWLVILGIGLGAGLLWLVLGRLPRQDDDVGPRERDAEAAWISQTIEAGGGIAPVALVDEILELHASYLDGPPILVEPAGDPPLPSVEPAADPETATPEPADTPVTHMPELGTTTAGVPLARPEPRTIPSVFEPLRPARPPSVGNGPSMQRHDARREAPEADVRQPG